MATGAFNSTLSQALNVFLSDVWEKLPPVALTEYWHDIIQNDPNMKDVYMTLDLVFVQRQSLSKKIALFIYFFCPNKSI